ncbi:Polyamine-modulated factor 1-binding protein 1, partial [Ophiophagus hannah]
MEQLQHKRDGRLSWMQSLKCGLEGQHQTLEMLLQECQALKAQLRQSKAVTQEQERERALQIKWYQYMQEQLRQAEASVHILESSLDLYKKKYQAALGRAGGLERQVHHLQEEARRKAARQAEKLDSPWSSGQAEESFGQLGAREFGWAMQLTGQQDQTAQELQEQLAASHSKQKEAVASLRREFASYKLTHSCSNTKHRKQMVSQAMLRQKLQQAGEAGLQQQAEAYQALVQELKLQLAREAEQNSRTLKDLARLELAVQSVCQEAATEQSRQAHAKQGRAASWPGGAPVLQPGRPKKPEEPQKAAVEMAQDQLVGRDVQLQCLGKDGCRLELLLGRGCRAEAELEQKRTAKGADGGAEQVQAATFAGSSHAGVGDAAAAGELREVDRNVPSPCPGEHLHWGGIDGQLPMQLQETEWRVQALQACVMEQKAESRSLQEQLTKQTAALGLVHGRFRQAWLQLQHQATQVSEPRGLMPHGWATVSWQYQQSHQTSADRRTRDLKTLNNGSGFSTAPTPPSLSSNVKGGRGSRGAKFCLALLGRSSAGK